MDKRVKLLNDISTFQEALHSTHKAFGLGAMTIEEAGKNLCALATQLKEIGQEHYKPTLPEPTRIPGDGQIINHI